MQLPAALADSGGKGSAAGAGRRHPLEAAVNTLPPLTAPDRPPSSPDAGWAPAGEPELPTGHVLDGRLRIQATISRGGMATIYRAEDLRDAGRLVAVKVPLAKVERDPPSFARFLREEATGTKLDHPQLVRFLPAPWQKSRPYLVMEFLAGRTLAQVLAETRPLPEARALRIASSVCAALQHMHERGVVHCDLKPANVMVAEDQTVRLFDFGLAAPPVRSRSLLAPLIPVPGTPEYMAPEQVEHGPVDERADIYALGVILYELLTSETPFHRVDPWESACARLRGDPVAPRKRNPAVSPQAEEIVLHALQRKPEDRYATAAALQADLDAPEQIRISGYCDRLQPPRWRPSLQGTPVASGLLLGVSALGALVGLFFALRMFIAR